MRLPTQKRFDLPLQMSGAKVGEAEAPRVMEAPKIAEAEKQG